MDIFGAARQKIGNAFAGGPKPMDPLVEQTVELLDDDPAINDADLAQELGLKNVKEARRYRSQAQAYLAQSSPSPQPPARRVPHQTPTMGDPNTQPLEGQATTIWQSSGNNTATMTPEELTARRHARVANAPVGRSTHDKFLLWIKGQWRIIGPVWFVAVTAGEVVDYLEHYMPHADGMTQILIWGVALFLEISMMVATYDLSNRNRIESEKRSASIAITKYEKRRTHLAVFFWFLLAMANITGQAAFLWFVTHPASIPGGPTQSVDPTAAIALYGFIAVRVIGMLVGDANTAFVLGDDEKELTQVARDEKERGEAFVVLALAEGDYRKNVAEADYKIAQVDAEVERLQMRLEEEKRKASYHAELDQMMMDESLERQRQRHTKELPPPQQSRGESLGNTSTNDVP